MVWRLEKACQFFFSHAGTITAVDSAGFWRFSESVPQRGRVIKNITLSGDEASLHVRSNELTRWIAADEMIELR
jgi:hypothetical protein